MALCGRRESNPHALRRYHLKVVRMPFRHVRLRFAEANLRRDKSALVFARATCALVYSAEVSVASSIGASTGVSSCVISSTGVSGAIAAAKSFFFNFDFLPLAVLK